MGLSVRAAAVRLLSVTAVAATACALTVGAASAATAKAAPKHATKTKVSVAKTAYVGASVKLSATVTGAGARPTGTVVFWLGTRKLCHGSLSKGSTHCDTSFSTAAYKKITAKYGGNSTHKASSGSRHVNIVRSATTTTITSISPDRDPAGEPSTVTVKVTAKFGTPTGVVEVRSADPGDTAPGYSCRATLAHGTGSCNIVPPAPTYGDISLQATYSGDAGHLSSGSAGGNTLVVPDTTTTSLTLAPASGTVNTAETLTADVVNQAADDITAEAGGTGTVTFSVETGIVTAPTNVCSDVSLTYTGTGNNVATCSWTPSTAGTYEVIAVYTGDEHNLASVKSVTFTVGS